MMGIRQVAVLIWMHHEGARAVYSKWLRPLAREVALSLSLSVSFQLEFHNMLP